MKLSYLAAASGLVLAMPVWAQSIQTEILTSKDPALVMKATALPGGKTAQYSLGVGSAAFRHHSDPADTIWTAGDRGPNMTCGEAGKLLNKEIADKCKSLKRGRVYPTPDYTPSIYRLKLDRKAGAFTVVETIPLRKAKSGKLVTGLLNPQSHATKDTGMDLNGKALPDDPDNIDLEGLVRMSDGSFWISEEMGPSIAHISKEGRILKRFVPSNQATDYAGAEAEISATLPPILSKRQGNRGFEALGISPDEAFLYFIVQNPLANPDAKAFRGARNTRLFKFDRVAGKVVGEYVYQLADPMSFGSDPSDKQSDPRISEIIALGTDRLLVLERTEKTTKLFEIQLAGATDILGGAWDDVKTSPSLEQLQDAPGVKPVTKVLRFDTYRDLKKAPEKLEGMAFLQDGSLVLINDNDFGIRGDETKVIVVNGAVTADPGIWKQR